MNIISLFSGAGGLDLGFHKAGFHTIWANEYDKEIWETFEKNHINTVLDRRSVIDIPSEDIPNGALGLVGGPPCQSWSEAGSQRGIEDARGQLFFEYIRVLRDKKPLFFLAENVQGMLFQKNRAALNVILDEFHKLGYNVSYKLLNTKDYGVPQDRKRVIFIGYKKEMGFKFEFPKAFGYEVNLREAIWDLKDNAKPALEKNYSNGDDLKVMNHEYMIGGFSTMYMSRNRVRTWDEPSFTIQAGGRHAPIPPQANKMVYVAKDKFKFDEASPEPYRRLSIREAARVQTFPDNFKFYYSKVAAGYKMIGNAVPSDFAAVLGLQIKQDLELYYAGKPKAILAPQIDTPIQPALFMQTS